MPTYIFINGERIEFSGRLVSALRRWRGSPRARVAPVLPQEEAGAALLDAWKNLQLGGRPRVTCTVETANPVLSICVIGDSATAAAQAEKVRGVEVLECNETGFFRGRLYHELSLAATGEYVAFITRQDTIATNYVSTLRGAAGEAQMISFDVDAPGAPLAEPHLSDLYMWRRDIQRRSAYPPNVSCGEAAVWSAPLFALGWSEPRGHIDRVLCRRVPGSDEDVAHAQETLGGTIAYHYHNDTIHAELSTAGSLTICRDHNNLIHKFALKGEAPFHIIEL